MEPDPIRAAAAEAKCREFCVVVSKILDAGFAQPGRSPLVNQLDDFVPDVDGKIWPKRPSAMSPADIVEYIEARFGPLFVGFVRSRPQFWVH